MEGRDGVEEGRLQDDREVLSKNLAVNSREGEAVIFKECEGVNLEKGGNDDLLLLSAQSTTPKVSVITTLLHFYTFVTTHYYCP